MRYEEYPLKRTKERTPIGAAVSSDDRYLAVLCKETGPIVYRLDTCRPQDLPVDTAVSAVDFRLVPSSQERREMEIGLALAKSGQVVRFNLDRHREQTPVEYDDVQCLAYSHDGSLLATGNGQGQVCLWELPADSGKPQKTVEIDLPRRRVVSMAFNSTNLLLYAVLNGGEVRMIELKEEIDRAVTEADDGWSDFECLAVHTHPLKPSFAVFCGIGPRIWVQQMMGAPLHAMQTPLGAFVRSARIIKDQNVCAVGQLGVCQVNLGERNVHSFFCRPEKSLILGGAISDRGFGHVAYTAAE